MSRKFLTALDLSKNELQNGVIQNLAAAPSSPVKGQVYFNTSDNTLYYWDGTAWVSAKGSAFYQTVKETGVTLTQRGILAFNDSMSIFFTGTDNAGSNQTDITAAVVMGNVTAETTFGGSSANGSAATAARSDHTHGNPVHDAAAHSTIPISALAAATGPVNMNGQLITNVGTPVSGTDAANKNYVDNVSAGLAWKDTVRAATTANITLSGTQTVDGVALVAGDRVLVKNQTTASANGIYVVAAGAWTRATDADTDTELLNMAVFVSEGTTQADTAWVGTANAPITVGTTNLPYVQFAGGSTFTAGAGLTQTGNVFDVGAGTGITVAADSVALDTTYTNTLYPPVARSIGTTAPLTGGGDLSANRTLAITSFAGSAPGAVPTSPGGTTSFLRADGTWAAPPGGVPTSRLINTTAPLTGGGDLSADRTLAISAATETATGAVELATVAEATAGADTTRAVTPAGLAAAVAAAAKRYAANVGGAVSQVLTHNLNTRDVVVNVYRNATPWDTVECDVERTDANNVTLRFTVAPATNEYRAVILA